LPSLFSATDPLGMPIECDSARWRNHIVAEHPEMEGRQSLVRLTIEQPLEIYESRSNPRRFVFYKPTMDFVPGYITYMRVVVEYEEAWFFGKRRGVVITAFPSDKVRQGDLLIWPDPARGKS
jgi:hypothetical protein